LVDELYQKTNRLKESKFKFWSKQFIYLPTNISPHYNKGGTNILANV